MYIYIDVLIITNIYANFFLLKTTARLAHLYLRNGKCILAALVGSLFSLIILLPPLNTALLLMIRILSAALMIIVAFSGKPICELYRTGLIFFFVCFIFAGMEYGLSVLSESQNMLWNNSTLYVNISLLTLVISTIVSYGAISFFRYYLDSGNSMDQSFTLIITQNNKTIKINAVGDTCNNLTDSFTGKPVIVCGKKSVETLFNAGETEKILSKENTEHISGWRLIPFSTISDEGMMPVFKPSGVIIKCTESGKSKSADVYIGIVDRDMEHAVFNPKIL